MSDSPRSVSLVIPAYNEEQRLPALLLALDGPAPAELEAAGLDYLEAIVVDDGSSDRTAAILDEAASGDPKLRPLLERVPNAGKGRAIARGIQMARGELVLLLDVDLSTPISCVGDLARELERTRAQIAIGSRDMDGSRVEAPLYRRALGHGFNLSVRILTGLDHPDTQCGFKLIETEAARRLTAVQVSQGFAYDVEMLVRARNEGDVIVDVPVTYLHDSRSKVRVAHATWEMARDLVRITARLGRRRRSHAH